MSAPSPSLRDHLLTSLSALPNASKLHLVSLTSTPKRTTSLFPHTPAPPRCFQVDYFVVLGCEVDVPPQPTEAVPSANGSDSVSTADATAAAALPSTSTTPERQLVLTSAISAHLYILPHSNSSILYISKLDSSSYPSHTPSSAPLPLTRTLITSFISYFLLPSTRPTPHVRVQLFARSQGQYLFPNSEAGKTGLGGARLCGWWKGVYEDVARVLVTPSSSSVTEGTDQQPTTNTVPPSQLYLAYLLPSFSSLEAQGVLGAPRRPLPVGVEWKYEPPFSTPLLRVGKNSYTGKKPWSFLPGFSLADLIPSLEDDPKTRFLDEIATATKDDNAQDEVEQKEAEAGLALGVGEAGYGGDAGDGGDGHVVDDEDKTGRIEDVGREEALSGAANMPFPAPGPGPEPASASSSSAAPPSPAPPSDPAPSPAQPPAPAQPTASSPSQPPKPHKPRDAKSATAQEDEAYRQRAHVQLRKIKPSEFWERMGFRGECAMDVTGFFSLAVAAPPPDWGAVLSSMPIASTSTSTITPSTHPTITPTPAPSTSSTTADPTPVRGHLPPAIVDRIQKALMNTDFSTLDWALQGSADWMASTRQIIAGEIGQEALDGWCEGVVEAKSAEEVKRGESKKREVEKEVVTVLQPRKKKKV